ncbi:hypothetical protein QL285_035626 [Trifolium repens]|nr:hypothetical protein QL285_035626 [Trifolium repens]
MHDRSRKSSLYRSLNLGIRCINSTALTNLFMVISSIKPLSRLIAPPSTPNVQRKQPLTKFAFITRNSKDLRFTNIQMKAQFGLVALMISMALATSFESPMIVPSLRYQA